MSRCDSLLFAIGIARTFSCGAQNGQPLSVACASATQSVLYSAIELLAAAVGAAARYPNSVYLAKLMAAIAKRIEQTM